MIAPAGKSPPRDEHELRTRAIFLAGRTLGDLARAVGLAIDGDAARTKGKSGTLIELALGATGGSLAQHDFPHLGVELKTIPVGKSGQPRESTYVCTLPIDEAERAEWRTSWVRRKLAHVLFVPIVCEDEAGEIAMSARRVGAPVFWRPTHAQSDALARDFEELMGAIAIGGADAVDARRGRYLQVRPKAASSRTRTTAWSPENERVSAMPRGFYLRTKLTGAILRDPAALPE